VADGSLTQEGRVYDSMRCDASLWPWTLLLIRNSFMLPRRHLESVQGWEEKEGARRVLIMGRHCPS
jgi:hypothetical protein